MIGILAVIFGTSIAAFAIYRWGRNSKTIDILKTDLKTGEKTHEILQKQRDGRVSGVDDADRMWESVEKD